MLLLANVGLTINTGLPTNQLTNQPTNHRRDCALDAAAMPLLADVGTLHTLSLTSCVGLSDVILVGFVAQKVSGVPLRLLVQECEGVSKRRNVLDGRGRAGSKVLEVRIS